MSSKGNYHSAWMDNQLKHQARKKSIIYKTIAGNFIAAAFLLGIYSEVKRPETIQLFVGGAFVCFLAGIFILILNARNRKKLKVSDIVSNDAHQNLAKAHYYLRSALKVFDELKDHEIIKAMQTPIVMHEKKGAFYLKSRFQHDRERFEALIAAIDEFKNNGKHIPQWVLDECAEIRERNNWL